MADSYPRQDLTAAAEALSRARRIVAFTGAGVSAKSGVATFREAGGLWESVPVMEVASRDGWIRDPVRVWRFYEARREQLGAIKPNAGHTTLAQLERLAEDFLLVTQNVDNLHFDAGSRNVIPIHGGLWNVKCTVCDYAREDRTCPFPVLPPPCPLCGRPLRPDIVWFGEAVPLYAEALAQMEGCDVFLSIGTSAVVYPAAGLIERALAERSYVIEMNPNPTPMTPHVDVHLKGPSGEILPQLLEVLQERL